MYLEIELVEGSKRFVSMSPNCLRYSRKKEIRLSQVAGRSNQKHMYLQDIARIRWYT